jgi:hypothetical protein
VDGNLGGGMDMSSRSASGRGNGTSLIHSASGRGTGASTGRGAGNPGVEVIVRDRM